MFKQFHAFSQFETPLFKVFKGGGGWGGPIAHCGIANQITGLYMKWNTVLKRVKHLYLNLFLFPVYSLIPVQKMFLV